MFTVRRIENFSIYMRSFGNSKFSEMLKTAGNRSEQERLNAWSPKVQNLSEILKKRYKTYSFKTLLRNLQKVFLSEG